MMDSATSAILCTFVLVGINCEVMLYFFIVIMLGIDSGQINLANTFILATVADNPLADVIIYHSSHLIISKELNIRFCLDGCHQSVAFAIILLHFVLLPILSVHTVKILAYNIYVFLVGIICIWTWHALISLYESINI